MAIDDVAADVKAAKAAASAKKPAAPEAPKTTPVKKPATVAQSAASAKLAGQAAAAKKIAGDIKKLEKTGTQDLETALANVIVAAKGIDRIQFTPGKVAPSGETTATLPQMPPGTGVVPPELGGPTPTGTGNAIKQPVDEKTADRRSAFALLREEFDRYGLGDLVGDIQGLAEEGISPAEFTLRLRQTQPYRQRFAANQQRINSGLRALSEAEYIGLEDQYQNIMRQYGLPASFYARGERGIQPEFQKFIAGDVSPAELEDRVQLAATRVQNAAPEILSTLERFYPGINKGNLLAYILDPQRALPEIQRKVQAAEIGAAAQVAGLGLGAIRAEELAARGITQQQAQQGYQTIAEVLPQAGKLANIYGGSDQYDQTVVEEEIFGLAGAASARRKRQRLAGLERGSFTQQTGMSTGALERNRSGAF